MRGMGTLKAEVRNGRLVMDEPTDLPEGTVIELDERRAHNDSEPVKLADQLTAEDLPRFRAELKESLEQARAGDLIPAEEVLEEL